MKSTSFAAAAKEEGLDETTFRINRDYKVDRLLADLYEEAGPTLKTSQDLEEEVDRVFGELQCRRVQAMDTFSRSNDVNAKMGTGIQPGILAGEGLERAKKSWARAKVLSDRAKADTEFMESQEVKLRVNVLVAGLLSSDLLRKHWSERIRATDREIAEFIAKRRNDLKRNGKRPIGF